jgi:hypothetical protein
MNRKERRDLTDSSQREHRIGFEGPGEQRSGKSLFQLALEVEDLLDKARFGGYPDPPVYRVSS